MMRAPTPRQQFLLAQAKAGTLGMDPRGRFYIDRVAGRYPKVQRNPRWPECYRLIDNGWINLAVNRQDVRVDSARRTRKYGRKTVITEAGKKAMGKIGG